MERLKQQSEVKQTEAQQTSKVTECPSTVLVTPPPVQTKSSIPAPPPRHSANSTAWLLRGLALGLTTVVSAAIGATVALMLPLPPSIAPHGKSEPMSFSEVWNQGFGSHITRPVNILVMGIDLPLNLPDNSTDKNVFSGRSDTMLLVRVDPTNNAVSVLSIPRDTQVEIAGEGVEKINYANALGGARLAAQVVSQNMNGIEIDRYVRVSTGAFRELVDLLGGVEVFVPERMEYQDQTQKLNIDLQPGLQTLNGDQAEQFARFRHDNNGDIGRVQRQQQLIRALREKLTNPAVIARLPQAIELFQKYIDTNLSFEEMVSLAEFGLGLDRDNFRMVMLPGRFSRPEEFVASYWIMDTAGRDQVLQEYFDISSVAELSQKTTPTDLRIAIQNASDDPHLGSQVAAYLESKGFSNVYVSDDWPDHQPQTQIIAQRGDLNSATMVESLLGVGQVVPASTGDIDSDLTIRVGKDWTEKHRI